MNTVKIFRDLERKLRLSRSYDLWISRNKGSSCFCCGKTDKLQCHHIVEVYHIFLGLWKLYGDMDKMYEHVLSMHDNDHCDCVTLCEKCHLKRHPGRRMALTDKHVHLAAWTVLPRNFTFSVCQSPSGKLDGELGLIGFQTVLGIGWHILNGHLDSRMIVFDSRKFAKLLGKTPSVSFNLSLDRALPDLQTAGILIAFHRSGNTVELHMNNEYLDMVSGNPWFMPFDNVKTSKPCALFLQWFLGMQSNRSTYRISKNKLFKHLGFRTSSSGMALKTLKTACETISWADMSMDKDMCVFSIKRRGGTPIYSLRQTLCDSIGHGMQVTGKFPQ